MLRRPARSDAPRLAAAALLATLMGCSSVSSPRAPMVSSGTPSARSERPSSRAPQAAPFGDFGDAAPAPATAAKPEAPEVVRTSAWSKLKDAIGRSSPQPIPLKAAESSAASDEERPFTGVDGRDF